MTTLTALRDGLAANLQTISGLRSYSYVPDDPKPPIAVIVPQSIAYDTDFVRGMDEYEFSVIVLVGKVSDRASQLAVDAYCNPSGVTSIKAAVASDPTLGGSAFDCRVREMRNYTQTQVGDVAYLSAEFVVYVIAN